MRRSDDEVFAYWERTWAHPVADQTGAPIDVIGRAWELINDEWSEAEAGRELAALATYDQLHHTQNRLLEDLLRTPFVDIARIRLSRVIWAALDAHQRRAVGG